MAEKEEKVHVINSDSFFEGSDFSFWEVSLPMIKRRYPFAFPTNPFVI